jgi:2-polyprenyl-3-methyl-5-hydroxy-6-metoxy-1,4-benzoquinol methylase
MTERGKPSRGADYFVKLYAENPDPWDFAGSSYENAKYLMTLAALGERNFKNAFEIGCSIGILTSMLATKCRSLLAVDVVDSALATARENCKTLDHVRFKNLQIPADWPSSEKFDLIICSEVLYFLSPEDIERVSELASKSLLPGGNVLLVNYTGKMDEPCSGDETAEAFIRFSRNSLAVQKKIVKDYFRIDLLIKFNERGKFQWNGDA